MMTRRWFLKLVSTLAPLFGVKAEVEAEQSIKQTYTGVDRRWKIVAPPPMTKLERQCRVPGTLTAAVLNAGCVCDMTDAPMARTSLEYVEEAEYQRMKESSMFTLKSMPLPKLDTVGLVEAATLGIIGDPIPGKGIYGVFNHPNAMRIDWNLKE